MDFYSIGMRKARKETTEIFPDFKVCRSSDLMIRGGSFYAVWDEKLGLWSTDEYVVQEIIDSDLAEQYDILSKKEPGLQVRWMRSYDSSSWRSYSNYVRSLPDNYHQLDETLIFQNTETSKTSYASKRLPYSLATGPCDAYEEMVSTLYDPDERRKFEWAIGSVVKGDSKRLQKFVVFYGDAGSGKSTILNIIQKLFPGYYVMFEANELTSGKNSFSTEVFRSNPLVAIQHDGDLSKIEDNTKLNSIVSHEEMMVNEKYKSSYSTTVNAFLFIGTNKPVRITDAKSGLLRRLIDVEPSGRKIETERYFQLMSQIDFELGAIASHCLEVYESYGPDCYSTYKPTGMMFKTDVFFNFVDEYRPKFEEDHGITLRNAWAMYQRYLDETNVTYKLPMYKFREELKNYFDEFYPRTRLADGTQVRNYYHGFKSDLLGPAYLLREPGAADIQPRDIETRINEYAKTLQSRHSLLDDILADRPAQYANDKGTPSCKWDLVKTTLADLDTSKVHYVLVPQDHVVIDFDIKDESGEKDIRKNIEAAMDWPPTYCEVSKSGKGLHLHYIYDGDASKLSRVYDEGIEIKVFGGKSSLRRKLTVCNDIPIAHISSGLPEKEEKMVDFNVMKNERSLRRLVERNLMKEIHPGTKPSVDFIKKILDDAWDSGMTYDISDMRPRVNSFAANSTHHAQYCIQQVLGMHFVSEDRIKVLDDGYSDDRLVFFDVEVFPNLFLVNWKYEGADTNCVRMINPSSQDMEGLFQQRLVGFNCRRYDNHICYARYLGYTNEQLYNLSQKIVNGYKNAFFGEAYDISYTDVYDFASSGHKKSLKKFEIELGITHKELGLPWDQPVDPDKWDEVAEYCDNDVIATEAVFHHLAGDWTARRILADISGLTVNDTTNRHTTKIVFGNDRHPQTQFEYPDLAETFPGYSFKNGKASYRGEDPGRGGYVYAEPGMYSNVALLDVASMHPTSIEVMNLFGPYTKRFADLKRARLCIKHGEYGELDDILDGALAPFARQLGSPDAEYTADDLSSALKTAINSVYGLTSAGFENPFRDPRNKENIVAKRGALFMIELKHACQERGWTVTHIKTDSIKLADYTDEMVDFVIEFGKRYGYSFELESVYDRMCLVNDAVYIARCSYGKHADEWVATGAQFQQPYVFKTLFSKEPIEFSDLCETKSVSTAIYIDANESLPDVSKWEKELSERDKGDKGRPDPELRDISDSELIDRIAEGHDYRFVGKVGSFCPVKPGYSGGTLRRVKDGKYYHVTGTKGYRWLESEMVKQQNLEDGIDLGYYNKLVDNAVHDISEYGDIEWFLSVDNRDTMRTE